MKCPFCKGEYQFYDSVLYYHDLYEGDCQLCEKGKVSWQMWLHYHLVNCLDWLLLR